MDPCEEEEEEVGVLVMFLFCPLAACLRVPGSENRSSPTQEEGGRGRGDGEETFQGERARRGRRDGMGGKRKTKRGDRKE